MRKIAENDMSAEVHCRAFVVQHPRSSRVRNSFHSRDSITGRNWLGCLPQLTADPPEETGDSIGSRNRVGCLLLCRRRCSTLCDLSWRFLPVTQDKVVNHFLHTLNTLSVKLR